MTQKKLSDYLEAIEPSAGDDIEMHNVMLALKAAMAQVNRAEKTLRREEYHLVLEALAQIADNIEKARLDLKSMLSK